MPAPSVIGGLEVNGNNQKYPWIGGPNYQVKIDFWQRYFKVSPKLIFHRYELGKDNPSKFKVMNHFHNTQSKLNTDQRPTQYVINDKNKCFITRLLSRLALVSVFNSTLLDRCIWKKCFDKTMPDDTPQQRGCEVLQYEYEFNLRVFHKILNVGMLAGITFDSMMFADVGTAMERDCTMYMSEGIVGDYVVARKYTQHSKDGTAINTKSYGYVTFDELFLIYPLVTGNVAQPRQHKQVKVANIDSWIQGLMEQMFNTDMPSKMDTTFAYIGCTPCSLCCAENPCSCD